MPVDVLGPRRGGSLGLPPLASPLQMRVPLLDPRAGAFRPLTCAPTRQQSTPASGVDRIFSRRLPRSVVISAPCFVRDAASAATG